MKVQVRSHNPNLRVKKRILIKEEIHLPIESLMLITMVSRARKRVKNHQRRGVMKHAITKIITMTHLMKITSGTSMKEKSEVITTLTIMAMSGKVTIHTLMEAALITMLFGKLMKPSKILTNLTAIEMIMDTMTSTICGEMVIQNILTLIIMVMTIWHLTLKSTMLSRRSWAILLVRSTKRLRVLSKSLIRPSKNEYIILPNKYLRKF